MKKVVLTDLSLNVEKVSDIENTNTKEEQPIQNLV